jgi:hypothetical protein
MRLATGIILVALMLPAPAFAAGGCEGEQWVGPSSLTISPGIAASSVLVTWELTTTEYKGYRNGANTARLYWQILKLKREGSAPGEYAVDLWQTGFVLPGFFYQELAPLAPGTYRAILQDYYTDSSGSCSVLEPVGVRSQAVEVGGTKASRTRR